MALKVKKDAVTAALNEVVKKLSEEGAEVDINSADISELTKAVNAEYKSGQRGTIAEIIFNLSDTIGLEEFDIIVD